jgi:hypothetical protein
VKLAAMNGDGPTFAIAEWCAFGSRAEPLPPVENRFRMGGYPTGTVNCASQVLNSRLGDLA